MEQTERSFCGRRKDTYGVILIREFSQVLEPEEKKFKRNQKGMFKKRTREFSATDSYNTKTMLQDLRVHY
jgi:hypothetical protein